MNFDPNVPIYLQIMDEFKNNIVSNTFALGSKVKSVRDLAIEYAVNPNTVQRALSELEREGLVYSERTSGRYITSDDQIISELKTTKAETVIHNFVDNMHALGIDDEKIMQLLKAYISK